MTPEARFKIEKLIRNTVIMSVYDSERIMDALLEMFPCVWFESHTPDSNYKYCAYCEMAWRQTI